MLHFTNRPALKARPPWRCAPLSLLCFHISLAACSITFNYPPCQPTDSGCLLALVITGFREQVIRSCLHRHPGSLLGPQPLRDGRGLPLLPAFILARLRPNVQFEATLWFHWPQLHGLNKRANTHQLRVSTLLSIYTHTDC